MLATAAVRMNKTRLARAARTSQANRRAYCRTCKGQRRVVVVDSENPERGAPHDRSPCPHCGLGVFVFRIVYGSDRGDIGGDDA